MPRQPPQPSSYAFASPGTAYTDRDLAAASRPPIPAQSPNNRAQQRTDSSSRPTDSYSSTSHELYFPNASPSRDSSSMRRERPSTDSYYAPSPMAPSMSTRSSTAQFGVPLLHDQPSRDSRQSSVSSYQTSSYHSSQQPHRLGNGSTEAASVAEKYALPSDPHYWSTDGPEADDYLHNPDSKRDRKNDRGGTIFTWRGLTNLGCLAVLVLALTMLFMGYPLYTEFSKRSATTLGGFNLGGINGSGQVPQMISSFGLIDKDTPQSAYTHTSIEDGSTMELVFSDEFETPGRTFFPGDDPYWEAADLHYWSTNNLEWYDPRQVTTKDGKLVITLDKIMTKNMNYTGGMITSWNKFCFQGGYVAASVQLPGRSDVHGLWPAFWTMGNLGRAAHGGSLDGMWPYSYDSCDVGTLANQTLNGEPALVAASGGGPNNELSFLPGQRLSRCTCPDDPTHPGPKHADGTWVGRSAPEIDVFEAQVDPITREGHVSLSAQWAPFNPEYRWDVSSSNMIIQDPSHSYLNTYRGATYQQASSIVSLTNQQCYEFSSAPCYSEYGFEYRPGNDGYIHWVSADTLAWTYRGAGMGANAAAGVGPRPVTGEPLYLLLNLGLSLNFGPVAFDELEELWPVHMYVDYVRVYQPEGERNVGCDPDDYPTAAYIARYPEAYTNPNISTWDQLTDSAPTPKNRLIDTC